MLATFSEMCEKQVVLLDLNACGALPSLPLENIPLPNVLNFLKYLWLAFADRDPCLVVETNLIQNTIKIFHAVLTNQVGDKNFFQLYHYPMCFLLIGKTPVSADTIVL